MWKFILDIGVIGVFVAFLLNICLGCRKTRKRNETRIKYYRFLLEEALEKSKKQTGLIRSYIEKQEQNRLQPVTLEFIPMKIFTRLKSIDSQGVFEALCKKFKSDGHWTKTYNDYNASLDYLEGMFCEELVRLNEYTIQKGYADQSDVKKWIDDIPDILFKVVLTMKEQLGEKRRQDPEYGFIDSAIKKYHELVKANSDMKRLNAELLEPLLEHITPYEAKPYAQEVILKCKRARMKMSEMEAGIEHSLASYREAIGRLEEHIDRVRKMVEWISDSQKKR
jgi:hypothetical protein